MLFAVFSRRRCRLLCLLSVALATPTFADPVTWISPSSGLWTDSTNWSIDPDLPDFTSDVLISQPGPLTVTLSTGAQAINSLVLDNTLLLSGGSLSVATTLQVAGQLTLAGGTLQGATLSTLTPGVITLSSGTLSNVTLASNLTATNPALAINSNFTLANATLLLTATTAGTVSFTSNNTLAGTGTLIVNGTHSTSFLGATSNLTIASGITVATGSASANFQVGTLINQGTLAAQISGKTISINSLTFTNNGTVAALNGGTISINSTTWTSPGTLSLDNASTLNLGGTFLPTNLAAIVRTGGTVNITGILDNSSNSLTLSSAYTVLGGTLKNGNVTLASGGSLGIASSGNLSIANLSVGPGAQLTQSGGNLTLTGYTQTGGTVSLGGTQSRYTFPAITLTGGSASLAGTTLKTLVTPALTLGGSLGNWTGQLDIGSGKVIVQPTTAKADALAALQDQVRYGLTYTAGITSASLPANMGIAVVDNAALATPFTTFGGQAVTTNSLLVARELLGDSNLSGTVDLNDLNAVLNHLGTTTPNWTDGNFDGAATIDLTDLNAVLNNLGVTFANNASVIAAEGLTAGSSPAPEPASCLLLAAALPFMAKRRARSR